MAYQHRTFHQGQRNYPLKQRKSPISLVAANDWFEMAPVPPVLKIAFMGTGSKLISYILTGSPTLPRDVAVRLDYAARYSAIVHGVTANSLVDLFLSNTNSIWDFKSYGRLFTDIAGNLPVTGAGQPVRLIKPLTGTNNLTLNTDTTPATVSSSNNLLFLNSPISEYRLTTKCTGKSFIFSHAPAPYIGSGGDTLDYPPVVSVWDSNSTDFFPSLTDNLYFSSDLSYSYYCNLWLNSVSIGGGSLAKTFGPHLVSVVNRFGDTQSFNSVSSDRAVSLSSFARHYVGNYNLIFCADTAYDDTQMAQLNTLCTVYSGLI